MTTRYTLSRSQAEQVVRERAQKLGVEPFVGLALMSAGAPTSYRLTFKDGGVTAYKSHRSERWAILHGFG